MGAKDCPSPQLLWALEKLLQPLTVNTEALSCGGRGREERGLEFSETANFEKESVWIEIIGTLLMK